MKKFILSVLILVVCFVIIWKVLKLNTETVSVDKTSNIEDPILTETFKGELFSFKYPKTFIIKNNFTPDNISLYGQNDLSDASSFIFNMSLLDKNVDSNMNIEEWWWTYGPQSERGAPAPDDSQSKLKLVNNNELYYTVYEMEGKPIEPNKLSSVNIYVMHNGNVFEILTNKLPSDLVFLNQLSDSERVKAQENEKIFWEILNTLEFK